MPDKKIIEENPGPSPVYLRIQYPDGKEVKILLGERLKVSPREGAFARIKELIDGAAINVV